MREKRTTLSIGLLCPDPSQPRKTGLDDEDLSGLSESIAIQGVLQELRVEEVGSGNYRIVCGERRYRAALKAGIKEVPVCIVSDLSEADRLEMQLAENLLRRELSSVERANAVASFIKLFPDQQSAAKRLGISKGHLSQILELTHLTPAVQEISEKQITRDATTLALANQLAKKAPEAAESLIEKAIQEGKLPRKAVVDALKPFRKSHPKKKDDGSIELQPALDANADVATPPPFTPPSSPSSLGDPRNAGGAAPVLLTIPTRRKLQKACRFLGLPESTDTAKLLDRLLDEYLREKEAATLA